MCGPLALAGAALATQVGGAVLNHQAQNRASRANAREAHRAKIADWQTLGLRQQEEIELAGQNIFEAEKSIRATQALAAVSAGESGVSGASVDALLHDIGNDGSAYNVQTRRNLKRTVSQLQRQKAQVAAQAQSRVNAVPQADPLATALTIAQAGLQFGNFVASGAAPSSTPATTNNNLPLPGDV